MEDTGNRGVVAMIVAVATIGGLLFGYDSGVMNGTQEGLKTASRSKLGRLHGRRAADRLRFGAFLAGRLADLLAAAR